MSKKKKMTRASRQGVSNAMCHWKYDNKIDFFVNINRPIRELVSIGNKSQAVLGKTNL